MTALSLANAPDRLIATVDGLHPLDAGVLGNDALDRARHHMPRVTGHTAMRLNPESGPGYFGISWGDPYVWFQERGTRPFLMRNLAGKTIPMWINDPHGEVAAKNPKAKTRITADGRQQTLIFRKVAGHGERKQVWRQVNGVRRQVSVPRSYAGAPGRIRVVETQRMPRFGIIPGQIATGNVGVRWRHPGLHPGHFIENAIRHTALRHGISDFDVLPFYGDQLRLDAVA